MSKARKEQITPEESDVRMLIATKAHIGSTTCTTHMTPYVFGRTDEGTYVFNPKMTLEKIRLAARIICGIENPADVCVVSGRNYGQRAVLKFAKYTGCTALPTKFTPGTFTNQIQKRFLEPRLLIVTDPITDHQPIMESSYVNIPVIAICDSDSPLRYIDVAIPANNKGIQQIGIIYWMLAREVLRIRGQLSYKKQWDVMPDLFFFREASDRKKSEEEEEEYLEEGIIVEGGHERLPGLPDEMPTPAAPAQSNWGADAAQAGKSTWGAAVAPPAAEGEAAEASANTYGVPSFK